MAHGEFVMIGAYMTFVTHQIFKQHLPAGMFDMYFFAAIIVAFLTTFLLGSIMERFIISRLYGREIDSLLATCGISLVLQQAARSIFGAQGVNVTAPSFLRGAVKVGGNTFSVNRIFIIGLVVVILVLLYLLIYRTNYGTQMRAVMQNRPMAQCLGINSRRIDNITFGIGSGLAGLSGCSIALLGSIDATVGQNYIVNSFMAVVLGGVGKLLGTGVGSSIMGFSSNIFEGFTAASIAKALVLILVIVFLQFKPQGLFTIRSRALDE
jgi:urea transport system permease protein